MIAAAVQGHAFGLQFFHLGLLFVREVDLGEGRIDGPRIPGAMAGKRRARLMMIPAVTPQIRRPCQSMS